MDTNRPSEKPQLVPVSNVRAFSFSRDRKLLAVGTQGGYVELIDRNTTRRLGKPIGRGENIVSAIAFRPDSKAIAVGYLDSRIDLLGVDGGDVIADLETNLPGYVAINDLLFTPDGHYLIESSGSEIRLWSVTFQEWKDEACSVANRELLHDEWQRYFPGVSQHKTCGS